MKKHILKLVSCMLALLIISAVFPFAVLSYAQEREEITFGTYPQSKVTDENLIASLDSLEVSWTAFDFYAGDGTSSSAAPAEYTFYTDAEYEGENYRGVYFTQYRPNSSYAAFPQESKNPNQYKNGYTVNTVYWFKYEPVVWEVLDSAAGLVMSKKVLDAAPFNNLPASPSAYIPFDSSTVKTFLNTAFAGTAFGDRELATLDGGVRLLTPSDVTNTDYGFPAGNDNIYPERVAPATEYAQVLGLNKNTSLTFGGVTVSGVAYWLDSEGLNLDGTAITRDANATVGTTGTIPTNTQNCITSGIRPAVTLKSTSAVAKSITYYCDPDGESTQVEYYMPGEDTVPFTPAEVTGYTFGGWDGEVPSVMPESDLEFRSLWTKNTYTLTLDGNGGTFKPDGSAVLSETLSYGDPVTEKTPEREGYLFNGWDSVFPDTMPANDLTLTAQWAGADDTPYTLNIYKQNADDDEYTLTSETRYGTTGTEAEYTAGAPEHFVINTEKSTLSTVIEPNGSGEISVYCDRETFTVTFDFADGETASVTKTYKYGQTLEIPEVPVREGFTCSGWNAPAACEGEAEYRLTWSGVEYTLTFDTAGGSAIPAQKHAYGDKITPPAPPVKDGFVFAGWTPAIPDTMPAKDVTVTASYRQAPSVSILGYQASRTVGYKVSVTYHADVKAQGDAKLVWVIGGSEIEDSGSRSYKVSSPKNSYSVQCKLVTADGTVMSEKENVGVQNNFFAKIVYIFRLIFIKSKLNIDQR